MNQMQAEDMHALTCSLAPNCLKMETMLVISCQACEDCEATPVVLSLRSGSSSTCNSLDSRDTSHCTNLSSVLD